MTFEPGTVVVFDPNNLNPEFWDNLSEEDRIKNYGALGYGEERMKLFVFLCEIYCPPDEQYGRIPSGHCVLASLTHPSTVEVMRHTSDFREVTEEEF